MNKNITSPCQGAVLKALKKKGACTAMELNRSVPHTPTIESNIRARLIELEALHLVRRWAFKRPCKITGKSVYVWKAVA